MPSKGRVVLAVSPPLLADALRRALHRDDLVLVDVADQDGSPYDLAVVTAGRAGEVQASRTITLRDADDARAAELDLLRQELAALAQRAGG